MLFLIAAAFAVEGMWEPSQLQSQSVPLRQAGFFDDPSRIADLRGQPLGAVVSLGGCTASFVSDLGLLITNHHCAVGMLQRAQQSGEDLVKTGFYAPTRSEERSAGAGARVWVTESFEDVTAKVTGSIPAKMPDLARTQRIDDVTKKLVSECERPGGLRCRVASYYEGMRYSLIRQLEITDVRVVMAPPDSVGNYGDEIDNWHWPRHAGDFSFLRAYVGRDGRPAPYSPDNVPYSPPQRLTVASRGPAPGEFVMVAGYPGSTSRWKTGLEVERVHNIGHPNYLRHGEWVLALLERHMAATPSAEPLLNVARFGLSNAVFNVKGTMAAFDRSGLVERAVARDAALDAWIAADPQRTARFGPALAELRTLLVSRDAVIERNTLMSWLGRSAMLSTARDLYRRSRERQKPDAQREIGFQERDEARRAARMVDLQASLYAPAEREGIEHFLALIIALPPDQQPAELMAWLRRVAPSALSPEAIAKAAADVLFADLALGTAESRTEWLSAPQGQIESSRDGFLSLAVALWPYDQAREQESKADRGSSTRTRPLYAEALRTFDPEHAYADANGTLRVSFGTVQGYQPRDAITYAPQTTVYGVAEKAGAWPFAAPPALLAAIDAKKWGPYADPALGTVPVDFLADLDTTGGNSGSPTLDAKGRLCGLIFDGNYEGIASDYLFEAEQARSIHVDIRYILFYLDAVAQADALLQEIGVQPSL